MSEATYTTTSHYLKQLLCVYTNEIATVDKRKETIEEANTEFHATVGSRDMISKTEDYIYLNQTQFSLTLLVRIIPVMIL